jgi:hypothetical protein
MGPKPTDERNEHDLFRTELANLIDQHTSRGSHESGVRSCTATRKRVNRRPCGGRLQR